MGESKPCRTPMEADLTNKLSKADSPSEEEQQATENVELKQLYQEAVGSLMYLMICTRPDIAFAVSFLSRFSSNPGIKHWQAVKQVFKYLNGTRNYGITLGGQIDERLPILLGYVDADFAADLIPEDQLPDTLLDSMSRTISQV